MNVRDASDHILDSYVDDTTLDGTEYTCGNVFVRTVLRGTNLLVTIRGTDTLRDWLDNLACWKTPSSLGGAVHTGFQRHMLHVRNVMIVPWSVDHVQIIGHSLGGAVGVLLASALAAERPMTHVHVTTFGAPRVGDLLFQQRCGSLRNLEITRVYSSHDPVTWVPYFGFWHVGHSFPVQHRAGVSWFGSHSAAEYTSSVQRLYPHLASRNVVEL